MKGHLSLLSVLILFTRYVDCLHCFQCSNITEGDDCNIVKQCLRGESCYSQRIGQDTLSHGCIERGHCPVANQFAIVGRAVNDHCKLCCELDGCNKQLCEEHVTSVPSPYTTLGTCADDAKTNCSQLVTLLDICSDVHHAKLICRNYCRLCGLLDGGWSGWTAWSSCSTSCGLGTITRQRSCTNPVPRLGGLRCTGNGTHERSCFLRPCPVHGEWSGWAHWEICSADCGAGLIKRHRTCTNPSPSLYGHYCIGDPVDYNVCYGSNCGNGTINATSANSTTACIDVLNNCDLLNKTTGLCDALEYARKSCQHFCGLCVIDGKWTDWTMWSSCSTTCGKGSKTRMRTCSNPAPGKGGKHCSGNSFDTHSCMMRECPVHGGWTTWAYWTTCSSTCGQGLTHRVRTCTNPRPSLLGNNCFGDSTGDSTEYGLCLIKPCPVDGKWTEWSVWSSCSKTCGNGQMTRSRTCSNPGPANGGANCTGSSTDRNTCVVTSCTVNGHWAEWSVWSFCSVTCGRGQTTRLRSCSNPRPSNGGTNCVGSAVAHSSCTEMACPVHGGWTSWGSWDTCDAYCGNGQEKRRRNCSNPLPSSGGNNCFETSIDSRTCYTGYSCQMCPGGHKFGSVRLVYRGSVSLVHRLNLTFGTVEFCFDGAWGAVCDDSWSKNDAKVVCRMLGFSGMLIENAEACSDAYYGQSSGSIVLDDVVCTGNETSLLSCSHSRLGTHNCGHSKDVGVQC